MSLTGFRVNKNQTINIHCNDGSINLKLHETRVVDMATFAIDVLRCRGILNTNRLYIFLLQHLLMSEEVHTWSRRSLLNSQLESPYATS
jgi:hypothetical protein